MAVLWFALEPMDVTLFRDGRPFTPGESSFARSLFPPNPSTVAGAMRTFIGRELMGGRFSGLGSAEYSPILFDGPYPFSRNEDRIIPLYPWPVDLVSMGKVDDMEPILFERRSMMTYPDYFVRSESRFPFGLVLRERYDYQQEIPELTRYRDVHGRFWIDSKGLRLWLEGFPFYRAFDREMTMVLDEPRPGIRMNTRTLTVDPEGNAFFFVQMNRHRDETGFLVGLERGQTSQEIWEKIQRFHESGEMKLLHLGGERRLARILPVNSREPEIGGVSEIGGKVRLYLLTPALISLNERAMRMNTADIEVEATLLAFAIAGSPGFYTGWDYQEDSPKAHRRLVPAGSVLVLQIHGEQTIPSSGKIGDQTTLGYGRYIAFKES